MPVPGNDLSLNSDETPICFSMTLDGANEDTPWRYSS
jgi:hypothetical protein